MAGRQDVGEIVQGSRDVRDALLRTAAKLEAFAGLLEAAVQELREVVRDEHDRNTIGDATSDSP